MTKNVGIREVAESDSRSKIYKQIIIRIRPGDEYIE